MSVLVDRHGRSFTYLRLSLTDACNFRCQYCLPRGYARPARTGDRFEDQLLTTAEIENLIGAFAELGFRKIRLTGGEPTLRPDIVEIVRLVADNPQIHQVALTTNGYRLKSLVQPLVDAGLTALNVSLDSLSSERFRQITGSSRFTTVLDGIGDAINIGLASAKGLVVKINVVMLKSFFEQEFPAFLDLVSTHPVTLRFIELMQTGDNREFFEREYISGETVLKQLQAQGWNEVSRVEHGGPARELVHADYLGRLGVIAPYSRDFCASCNRLRVSARGKLKLCLFGDGDFSLRRWLQRPEQRSELCAVVREVLTNKLPTHYLHEGQVGTTAHLASIGG